MQTHRTRTHWAMFNAIEQGFSERSRALTTTALYSNGTWLTMLPSLFVGGTAVAVSSNDMINKAREKAANLLDETLVMYGSDMSDGNIHLQDNLPMLLCGAGSDLRFGQEIVPATPRPLSDLHVEIAGLLGLGLTLASFGSGPCRSTGQPLGIHV